MDIDGKGIHAGSVPSRDKMGLIPAAAETATNTRFFIRLRVAHQLAALRDLPASCWGACY
jgi:hypothetical protein